MRVKVEFAAQLRDIAGLSEQSVDVPGDSATVADLMSQLADEHGEPLRKILIDDGGQMSRWILVDLEGVMIRDASSPISDGDTIRLLSPISGG